MASQQEPQPQLPWHSRMRAAMARGGSAGWLIATLLQGLLTWAFIGVSELSAGWPWANQARLLVVIAILATWGMALRTIRARLVELIRVWHRKLVEKSGTGGLGAISKKLLVRQEKYVHATMTRLRIIAAGITIPFFVMPVFVAVLCFAIAWHSGKNELVSLAVVCSAMAAVVAYYFRWSILAAPVEATEAPARIAMDRHIPARLRRKWKQGND
ncbi:MAG: hypothetical protein HY291_01920 [Planctomycetes bacterium]|nr:hypothetical protein [Planctomycetota bacterium]